MPKKRRNLTTGDAKARVDEARDGSLADASDAYLAELQRQARCWLASIDYKIATRKRLAEISDGT